MVTRLITNRKGKKYTENPQILLEDIKKENCRSLTGRHYALVFQVTDILGFNKFLRGNFAKRTFEENYRIRVERSNREYAFVNHSAKGLIESLQIFLIDNSLRKKGIKQLGLYEVEGDVETVKQKKDCRKNSHQNIYKPKFF